MRTAISADLGDVPAIVNGRFAHLDVALWWYSDEPFAVSVVFEPNSADEVTWDLSRESLIDGTEVAAGMYVPMFHGDVAIGTLQGMTEIALTSPAGCVAIQTPTATITHFLTLTEHACPLGQEETNLPNTVAELFMEGS